MFVLLAALALAAQAPVADSSLAGTSWQLVRFQGGDGKTLTPDERAKYTIAFAAGGGLQARIDCNRGRGTWTSAGPSQLQLGPLALTRAFCGEGSLHDRIVKDWGYVRSFVVRDGRLFLSLQADAGIYELEPAEKASSPPKSSVASTGPVAFECASPGSPSETLSATFYRTEPGLVLVERAGRTRPAFGVVSASGARYEGEGLSLWEARGEATVTWSGSELRCKKR